MRVESSYIELKGLRFHARHGVLPQEKIVGGDYVVNLRVHYNISRALETDDVNDTLNYADIYQIINKVMQKPSCLLEHVVGRIGESIFKAFPEAEVAEVDITKCNPPMRADCEGATVHCSLHR
ncbi:MAG: dihydroneopterin aldolase [Prevotella sp.]|nr:dihydroneopterin aldolase [Prevotella sp.]